MAWLGLGCALFAGAFFLFWRLGDASLYTDEAYTFALGRLDVHTLIHTLSTRDFHPPLFYLATHGALTWLRWPPWDYRYLSAPFGLVTILATWGAARRMFGDMAAAGSAVITALAPTLLVYDRMYRMYVVLVCFSTLTWWLLLEAQHARGKSRAKLWTGYAIASAVLAYSHYLGFLVLVCQGVYALTHLQSCRGAFAAYALVALAYVPWVSHLVLQLPLGGIVMTRPGLDAGLAASVRGAYAQGLPSFGQTSIALDWVITGGIATIVLWGGWLGRLSALPYWLGCLPLAIGASIAFDKNLAYFPSYLLIDIPPVAIAISLIVSTLCVGRARVVGWALGLGVLGFELLAVSNVLLDPYYQFPDWYAVNAVLARHERASDAIVLDAGYEQFVVRDYSSFRGHTMLSFMNPSDFSPILGWIATHPKTRVWYVEHQNFYWDPSRTIEAALAKDRRSLIIAHFPRQSLVNEVTVILFGNESIKKS